MIVCLFDIDGTLLASGGAGKAALEAALTEDFATRSASRFPTAAPSRLLSAIFCKFTTSSTISRTSTRFSPAICAACRIPCVGLGRVLPGIIELLENLQQRPDVAVGLLTGNVRAGARAKLGHFGLFDKFAFGGFGDHHFDRDDVAREALAEVAPCRRQHRRRANLGHWRHPLTSLRPCHRGKSGRGGDWHPYGG